MKEIIEAMHGTDQSGDFRNKVNQGAKDLTALVAFFSQAPLELINETNHIWQQKK